MTYPQEDLGASILNLRATLTEDQNNRLDELMEAEQPPGELLLAFSDLPRDRQWDVLRRITALAFNILEEEETINAAKLTE